MCQVRSELAQWLQMQEPDAQEANDAREQLQLTALQGHAAVAAALDTAAELERVEAEKAEAELNAEAEFAERRKWEDKAEALQPELAKAVAKAEAKAEGAADTDEHEAQLCTMAAKIKQVQGQKQQLQSQMEKQKQREKHLRATDEQLWQQVAQL